MSSPTVHRRPKKFRLEDWELVGWRLADSELVSWRLADWELVGWMLAGCSAG